MLFLFELHKNAVSTGRMNERHKSPFSPRARLPIDQRHTSLVEVRQHRIKIVDPERDVVQARDRAAR